MNPLDDDHDTSAPPEVNQLPLREPSVPRFVPQPSRSGRARRFPAIFKDFLPNFRSHTPIWPPRPEKSAPVLPATLDRPSCSPTPTPSYESPADDTCFTTEPDQFGLYRVYPRKPFHEPDDGLAIENACDEPNRAVSGDRDSNQRQKRFGSPTTSTQATLSPFAPLSNATSFRLLDWFYGGSRQKSQIELTSLVEKCPQSRRL
ncbi:hypothetical protein CPB84DRAFT_1840789 [Gymnopilus junonius]|uniref:Uncharacterized protein n=1 Tax=Gymnopilus junonius TaxID=109634 RepID=A0A9P5P1L7_GYMJU|nr:hypothetical protein CPB84DRAFT_1840789 [Gymnopilus junonius]